MVSLSSLLPSVTQNDCFEKKVLDLVQWYHRAPPCQRLHKMTVVENDQKVLDLVQWYPLGSLLPAVTQNYLF